MLNDLSVQLGAALEQERIYVAFADRTWILDAGERLKLRLICRLDLPCERKTSRRTKELRNESAPFLRRAAQAPRMLAGDIYRHPKSRIAHSQQCICNVSKNDRCLPLSI
jgi:hypothetical protein